MAKAWDGEELEASKSDLQSIAEKGAEANSAFNRLYDRYHRAVLSTITRVVTIESFGNAIQLELAQEVWIRVWDKALLYKPSAPPEAWLRTIAKNHALNYVKPNKNRVLESIDVSTDQQIGGTHASSEHLAVIESSVEWAFEQIVLCCPECERLILLKTLDSLSTAELAQVLDTTSQAARQRLYECRKCLRQLIDQVVVQTKSPEETTMTEQDDWLNELYDLPDTSLSDDQRTMKAMLQRAMVKRESNTLPWSEEQLTAEKKTLFDKLHSQEAQTAVVDQPTPLEQPKTQEIKQQAAHLSRLSRLILPLALAASVAMVAFTLMPISSELESQSLQELLSESNIPNGYRLEIIGGSASKGASSNPSEKPVLPSLQLTLSVKTPEKTTFDFMQYFHQERIPYWLFDQENSNKLKLYVGSRHLDAFNTRLATYGIGPTKVGLVELWIEQAP